MRPSRALPGLLALLCVVGSACVSANWTRQISETAIRPEQLERLPEDAELADCLALFGAPLFVWEDTRGSHAIAYGWQRQRDLGMRVSLPISDAPSASFQYADAAGNAHGLVLFFDEDWRLRRWRFGFLRELTPSS